MMDVILSISSLIYILSSIGLLISWRLRGYRIEVLRQSNERLNDLLEFYTQEEYIRRTKSDQVRNKRGL